MARSAFPVEVLTPEGSVFAGEVEMLSTRTEVGEIGVLANHTPLLAMLAPADLRLHLSETEVKHFAQGEGYLQVHGNHALVLVEDCFEPESIDRAEQEDRLRKARERAGGGQDAGRPHQRPLQPKRCATSAVPRRSCASPAPAATSPRAGGAALERRCSCLAEHLAHPSQIIRSRASCDRARMSRSGARQRIAPASEAQIRWLMLTFSWIAIRRSSLCRVAGMRSTRRPLAGGLELPLRPCMD